MGNSRNTGFINNIIKYDANGNVNIVSGSTTLLYISSSGAITTTGVISGSNALSASYALTASFVTLAQTASFVTTAQTASFVTTAQTASFVTTAQTASFVANAQSASNAVTAQTASFANTFTVASTLTAQTLVVQTITSSVDFVTGSTRFGSLLTNTHVFSGSVSMNGPSHSIFGNVGFGVTTPTAIGVSYTTLDVRGSIGGGVNFGVSGSTYAGLYADNGGINLSTNFAVPILFGVSGSERMRITSGSIGIGTSAPSTFFEVYANTAATNLAYFTTSGSANRMLLGTRNIGGGALIDIRAHGSTYTETILGNSMSNAVGVLGAPASTASMVIGATTNNPVVFGTNNQEVMRITGSLIGIGLANPTYTLHIITSATYGNAEDGNIAIRAVASGGTVTSPTTVAGIVFGDGNLVNSYMGRIAVVQDNPASSTTSHMRFYTNNGGGNGALAERMRITNGGNLGLGITPSAWDTTQVKVLELGTIGNYFAGYVGSSTIYLGNNSYLDAGGWKYARAAASSQIDMGGGGIRFLYAATGTAGSALTWNESMRTTSSGSVGINTAGSICKLVVADAGTVITSGNVTFDSQAKGIELYNTISGTTDNLVGYWFSVGPHKSGIASGRTNAGAGWELDLRFFTHGSATTNLNNTYENMRLYGNGNLTINGSLTQNGGLSDINLKENLVKINSPLEKISQINGYNFDWKEGTPANGELLKIVHDAGLIAQEVEIVMPDIVRNNKWDGTKMLNYNGIIALLVEGIKEQQAQIEELKAKING